MASGDPIFGVITRVVDDEPRPVIAADLSTVGIVGPAPLADPEMFPVNTPVLVYSDDLAKLRLIGDEGFILDAYRGINDQLGELQRAARTVFVRTPVGTNVDPALRLQETIARVMGDSTAGTGLWALTMAGELLGCIPRLITAPGYTGQLANGIATITIATPGSGLAPDTEVPLTITGGGTTGTIVQGQAIAEIDEDGEVSAVRIEHRGQWYTTAPTVTFPAASVPATGATAPTFTVTIDQTGNPVCAAAPAVLNQLLGHMVVESVGTSEILDKHWRETFQSQRLIPVSGGVKTIDPVTGFVVIRPLAPRVIGIGVRRDFEKGAPFHSWANQPVIGIVGPQRGVRFSLSFGGNEGQSLLEANIGIVAKGEVGVETAIATGGYVFIGTDNAGEDELWRFYSVTRGRDYIHLSLIRAMRFYLGRFNITAQTIQAILNTMDDFLSDLEADEHILGYIVTFRAADNSAAEIRTGHLTIGFRAEEPPVLRKLTIRSSRYKPAIDAMVQDLESQLSLAA